MTESMEELKRHLAGYLMFHGFGEIDKIWRDRSDWHSLENDEWVEAVLWIEESPLFAVFGAYFDGWVEYQNQFELLLQKCGVHWEMQNQCVIYLGDELRLDEICERKRQAKNSIPF